MQPVGFKVERLEGPPGKREMLRGWRWITVLDLHEDDLFPKAFPLPWIDVNVHE